MRKLIAFVMAFVSLSVLADRWTDPETGITWTYTLTDDGASLGGGNPDSPAISTSTTGAIVIPAFLGSNQVERIGDYAFWGCYELTSVTMPEGVASIGRSAFQSCIGLTAMTIPLSVTNIGEGAFTYCNRISSLSISSNVVCIGGYAFSGCSQLLSIDLPSNIANVANGMFRDCYGLKSVKIPSCVTNIGEYAFEGCVSLASLEMPTDVTSIGHSAFNRCSGLTEMIIPEGVTSIGSYAFGSCDGMSRVEIPSSVTNVGDLAFIGCSGVQSFVVAQDNPYYCSEGGFLCSKYGETLIAGINGDVAIPSNVTRVARCSFQNYKGLRSVVIPSKVMSIGNYAFSGCSEMTKAMISEGVTNIEMCAFSYCAGLTSVALPRSVTTLGSSAFSDCEGLRSVTIPSSVKSIGSHAFSRCSELEKVYVDKGDTGKVSQMLLDSGLDVTKLTFVELPDDGEREFFGEATGAPAEVVYIGCEGGLWEKFNWDVVTFEYGTARSGPGCSVVDEDGNYMDWYNISSCCWYENPSFTNITPKALRSAPVTEESSESVMSVKVNGPGRLSFVWGLSKGTTITPTGESYIVYEGESTGRYYDRDVYYGYEYIGSLTCYLDGEECAHVWDRDRGDVCTIEISGEGEHVVQWLFEFAPTDVWSCCSIEDDPFGYVGSVSWAKEGDELSERKIGFVMLSTTQFKPYEEYYYYYGEWYSDWVWGAPAESIRAYGYYGEMVEHYDDQLPGCGWRGYRPEAYVFTDDGIPMASTYYAEELCGDNVSSLSEYDRLRIVPGTTTVKVEAGDGRLTGAVSAEYSVAYGGDTFESYSYYMDVRVVSNTGDETLLYGSWWDSHDLQFDYNGENVLFDLYNEMSPAGSSEPDQDCYDYRICKLVGYDEWWNPIYDEQTDGRFWFYDYYDYYYNYCNWQRAEPLSFRDAGVYVIEFPEYRHRERWNESPYLTEEFELIRNSDTYTITINPKEITADDFELDPAEVVFDVMEHSISVTCKDFPGFTGEVVGNVVTNVGDYVIYVTATGNFSGLVELPIRVLPKPLSDLTTTVDVSAARYYTGSSNIVSIAVEMGDRELVEGVDYVVEYADNVNPGVATVSVIGTNNYCGTITRQWTILAREDAEIVGAWSEPRTFEYDGKVHGVDYSARLDVMEWPLNVVTQGTIRAVNVGAYAATARVETVGVPETDTVYYRCAAVTNECRWTITPKPVTKLQIDYVSTAMIANGQQQKPQIVVRDVERGVVLTSADYALAYENNVEPGMGIARITGKRNYGGETTIEFPIVAGVSPVEGLNMDGCTFEIVGETDWVADNVVTHDGYASMRSGAIGDNETSALTAVVHGAGTVSFWWKVSSQHFDSVLELDRLEFYVDGVRQKWMNGDVDWTKLSFKVNGAGPHELKWVYAKDGSISEGQDCGWVDEVSWEKEWLIGDWLNDVDREFATSNIKWSPDATVSSDGVGSMRSGTCQQGQKSVLSTVVENVGTLTFKWKCSCVAYGEYITDKLSLLVDGVAVKDADGKDIIINGQTGWRDVTYRITGAGRHEVQWVFEKVSDASMGRDCGWVDVVCWDNEPGTLTDEDLVVDAFDGTYDGQGHGAAVSVKGVHGASVKYGTSREAIGDAEPPTFVNCGEHEVWFAVNVPDFNEYVGKMVVRIRPRSIGNAEVTLGESLVYTGSILTQTVASVVVDGLAATFEVSDNAACAAGLYQLTVTGIGNFCGELSVLFAVAKAQALSDDVTVEGYSPDAGAVEFTYDGEAHQPTVVARYDGAAVVRFALTEAGPYADELNVSNAVERLDVWYEISSANYERLVGRTQMTIRPMPIAGAEVVLGEQVSDVEGHVVQLVDSVIVNGLPATFVVSNNVATAEGDFELCVYGTGNFTGTAKCPYSVGGIVLPPGLTPGDGTIFTESLVVRFSAQTPDSKWYYTLDGSMPTTNSLKAARVNLHGKTTIRAIAVLDGKLRSAVVEARYALGACENPTVRLDGRDGCEFHFPGQLVVIDRNGDEGVVRYTLDGSEPTAESPAYEGPFAISASTTVKAKTFSDSWFDSETATVDLRLEVLSVPPPVIQAASEYKGTRTTVSMSCALDGAVIRYTLDGSEPTATSALYEKPFEIGGAVGSEIQVRARAFREGYEGSSVAEVAVKRVWGIGDTLGVPDMMFTTDGWTVDPQETFGELVAMRSGPTGDGETNALATVVHGGGVVAFSWRTSCEDSFGDFIWDRAEFWVDDVCVAKVEGETSWNGVEHEIPDDGADHVLRWLYVKDPDLYTAEGEDCAWLAAVSWTKEDAAPTVIVTEDPNGEIVLPAGKDISEVAVSVMCNGYNIFPYLNLPAAVNGVIDLSQATVKDEIAKEPLDTTKGAKIELRADDPKITTAPTKPGLTYTLREGETLGGMVDGDSKVGDGEPWTPEIKVKGGNSAFYSIGVSKGE